MAAGVTGTACWSTLILVVLTHNMGKFSAGSGLKESKHLSIPLWIVKKAADLKVGTTYVAGDK